MDTAAPQAVHELDINSDLAPFDVGIHEKLPVGQLILLGIQHIFGMAGMFIFPALLGHAFNLEPAQIAYIYGMTFIVSGVVSFLQATVLRLPIMHGPFVGSFVSLIAIGHLPGGGLDVAFGSMLVASIIWALLALPIRGFSVCGYFARFLDSPLITGSMVILSMIQVAGSSFPNWLGTVTSPGFPSVNLLGGLVSITVFTIFTVWGGVYFRRGAVLAGLIVGTIAYSLFVPISLRAAIHAPWIAEPQFFPFGFRVRPDLVVVLLLVMVPSSIASMALYRVVGRWGGDDPSPSRMSLGLMTAAFGGMLSATLGTFGTYIYPDNIGMLRSTRVASRYATMTAGLILIILGACVKFDMLLVAVPGPVVAGVATLLFGMVLAHGIGLMSKVVWTERNLIIAGFGIMIGMGILFVSPEANSHLPIVVQLLLHQPMVLGGIPLIVLHALLADKKKENLRVDH